MRENFALSRRAATADFSRERRRGGELRLRRSRSDLYRRRPQDGWATSASWQSPLAFLKFAVEYHAVGSFAARVVAGILAALGGATSEDSNMKATLDNRVIAESDDIVECDGYHYFPSSAVRLQWLEKAPKTDSDRACPHGVQFYEAPRPAMQRVAERFGFWKDVKVA
jgi:uncharacterized protein (DUF427 family)